MKIGRLSRKEKLVIQPFVLRRHNFIPQTFREFYEDVRADTDAKNEH